MYMYICICIYIYIYIYIKIDQFLRGQETADMNFFDILGSWGGGQRKSIIYKMTPYIYTHTHTRMVPSPTTIAPHHVCM